MPLAAHGATLLLGVVRQAYDVDSDRNGLSLVTIYISVISVLARPPPTQLPVCTAPWPTHPSCAPSSRLRLRPSKPRRAAPWALRRATCS